MKTYLFIEYLTSSGRVAVGDRRTPYFDTGGGGGGQGDRSYARSFLIDLWDVLSGILISPPTLITIGQSL